MGIKQRLNSLRLHQLKELMINVKNKLKLNVTGQKRDEIINTLYDLHNGNKYNGKLLLSLNNNGLIKLPIRANKPKEVKKPVERVFKFSGGGKALTGKKHVKMTVDELYGPLEPLKKRDLKLEELAHISKMNQPENWYDDLDHEIYKDVKPDNKSLRVNKHNVYMKLHLKHKK